MSSHVASGLPSQSLSNARINDHLILREAYVVPVPVSMYETKNLEETSSAWSQGPSGSSRSSVAHAQSTTLPSSMAIPYDDKVPAKVDINEDGSVWSDDGLHPDARTRLIARLSSRIERDMHHVDTQSIRVHASDAARQALVQDCTDIMKNFASLLDSKAKLGVQHRSAVFLRMQRRLIVEHLMADAGPTPSKLNDMSLAEKMSRWDQSESSGLEYPPEVDLSQLPPEPEEEAELDVAEFVEAERFLFDGADYTWLIRHLNARNHTFESTGEMHKSIRTMLVEYVKEKAMRDRRIMRIIQVSLRVPWNPLQFMQEQYGQPSQAALSDVICLVGLPHRAFATSCRDYAQLLWSELGPEVIQYLDDLCKQGLRAGVSTLMTVVTLYNATAK
ncbi:hypothetical protein LTR95_012484 [Oleoguttula sp. CCFEE 5521]